MFPSHLTYPGLLVECSTLHLPKPELSTCAQMLPMGSTEMLAPHRETQSRSTFQFGLRESSHFNDLHVGCHLEPGGTLTPQYRFSSWLLCTQCPHFFFPTQHSPLHARRVPDPRTPQLTQTGAFKGPTVTQVPRVPHTIRMLEESLRTGETALLSTGSAQNLAALYSRTKSAPKV